MKKGFTLAEVLITLGIIGVVAALTAPALVQNAGNAKVGPTLSKVVATLENANEQILHEEEASDLDKVASNTSEYYEILSRYVSGSSYDDTQTHKVWSYDQTEGIITGFVMAGKGQDVFHFSDNIDFFMNTAKPLNAKPPKGSFKGLYGTLFIDINGQKTKPNSLGKDIFAFYFDRSGQIVPQGSNTYAWLNDDDSYKYTTASGNYACNETKVTKGYGCAGSIFENNLKVIYQ